MMYMTRLIIAIMWFGLFVCNASFAFNYCNNQEEIDLAASRNPHMDDRLQKLEDVLNSDTIKREYLQLPETYNRMSRLVLSYEKILTKSPKLQVFFDVFSKAINNRKSSIFNAETTLKEEIVTWITSGVLGGFSAYAISVIFEEDDSIGTILNITNQDDANVVGVTALIMVLFPEIVSMKSSLDHLKESPKHKNHCFSLELKDSSRKNNRSIIRRVGDAGLRILSALLALKVGSVYLDSSADSAFVKAVSVICLGFSRWNAIYRNGSEGLNGLWDRFSQGPSPIKKKRIDIKKSFANSARKVGTLPNEEVLNLYKLLSAHRIYGAKHANSGAHNLALMSELHDIDVEGFHTKKPNSWKTKAFISARVVGAIFGLASSYAGFIAARYVIKVLQSQVGLVSKDAPISFDPYPEITYPYASLMTAYGLKGAVTFSRMTGNLFNRISGYNPNEVEEVIEYEYKERHRKKRAVLDVASYLAAVYLSRPTSLLPIHAQFDAGVERLLVDGYTTEQINNLSINQLFDLLLERQYIEFGSVWPLMLTDGVEMHEVFGQKCQDVITNIDRIRQRNKRYDEHYRMNSSLFTDSDYVQMRDEISDMLYKASLFVTKASDDTIVNLYSALETVRSSKMKMKEGEFPQPDADNISELRTEMETQINIEVSNHESVQESVLNDLELGDYWEISEEEPEDLWTACWGGLKMICGGIKGCCSRNSKGPSNSNSSFSLSKRLLDENLTSSNDNIPMKELSSYPKYAPPATSSSSGTEGTSSDSTGSSPSSKSYNSEASSSPNEAEFVPDEYWKDADAA